MVSAGLTTRFIIWEASQTDARPPPNPQALVFLTPPLSPQPPPSLRPSPGYELFPESVTGVIESALSSLSAKY